MEAAFLLPLRSNPVHSGLSTSRVKGLKRYGLGRKMEKGGWAGPERQPRSSKSWLRERIRRAKMRIDWTGFGDVRW